MESDDPFSSLIKHCRPTSSPAARLATCPFAGEPDNFADSQSGHPSSSPDPTQSQPDPILMVSPPDSVGSVHGEADGDEAAFLTPPEHHNSNISSSEDQSPGDEVNAPDGSRRVRFSEAGETVPAGETEVDVGKGRDGVEVICLDSSDEDEGIAGSDEDMDIVRKDEGIAGSDEDMDIVRKDEETAGLDSVKGSEDIIRKGEERVILDSAEGSKGLIRKDGSVGCANDRGRNTVSELVKDGVADSGGSRHGLEKGMEVDKCKRAVEERYSNGNCDPGRKRQLPGSFEGIEDIYEFGYLDGRRRLKGKVGDGSGGKGQLPESRKGKEKDVGSENVVEKKKGLMDYLDVLKGIFADAENRCDDEDFLETAKKRGMAFPRPRWWPPEGEDW